MDEGDEIEESQEAIALFKNTEGVTYLEEGYHTIKLPDGRSFSLYASPYQPEFNDMAFNYPHDEDRFGALDRAVDVVITHGPPKGTLDECSGGSVGCNSLSNALKRSSPKLHCFGHIHEGYGAGYVKWTSPEISFTAAEGEVINGVRCIKADPAISATLEVNAAIMNGSYNPCSAPIHVSLPMA